MAKRKADKITTGDIVSRLESRYTGRPGEWAYASEVASSTGGTAKRRMDFAAVSCWPSNGLQLYGHLVGDARAFGR